MNERVRSGVGTLDLASEFGRMPEPSAYSWNPLAGCEVPLPPEVRALDFSGRPLWWRYGGPQKKCSHVHLLTCAAASFYLPASRPPCLAHLIDAGRGHGGCRGALLAMVSS